MIACFEEWYGDNFQSEAEAKKKADGSKMESKTTTPIQKTRKPVGSDEEDEKEED